LLHAAKPSSNAMAPGAIKRFVMYSPLNRPARLDERRTFVSFAPFPQTTNAPPGELPRLDHT
jgi:hypothetical protein